jgi:hypothetical protein
VSAAVVGNSVRPTRRPSCGTPPLNLKRAHALLETGKARGKIVLEGF